ncbi:hypothetical protein [Halocatena pleomorpha]|nr:hypothetical protein [Halocatena pleomorpha]
MSSSTPLQVCFLTGQRNIADWMVASVRAMMRATNAELSLVVHATSPDEGSTDSTLTHRLKRYCHASVKTVKYHIRRDPQTYTALSAIDGVVSVPCIQCKAQPAERLGVNIPSGVVKTIANACDVVVHYRVGILQGDILTRPQYGVLSFHHGDIRQYRGTPAGLWEFLHDAPQGGVTLQQLTPKLDAGAIVAFEPVDLTDATTWAAVRQRLFRVSPMVLVRGIRHIQDPSFEPVSVPDEDLGTLYYLSDVTLRVQAQYLFKEIRGLMSKPDAPPNGTDEDALAYAVGRYALDGISISRAAELADVDQWTMVETLQSAAIPPKLDPESVVDSRQGVGVTEETPNEYVAQFEDTDATDDDR